MQNILLKTYKKSQQKSSSFRGKAFQIIYSICHNNSFFRIKIPKNSSFKQNIKTITIFRVNKNCNLGEIIWDREKNTEQSEYLFPSYHTPYFIALTDLILAGKKLKQTD